MVANDAEYGDGAAAEAADAAQARLEAARAEVAKAAQNLALTAEARLKAAQEEVQKAEAELKAVHPGGVKVGDDGFRVAQVFKGPVVQDPQPGAVSLEHVLDEKIQEQVAAKKAGNNPRPCPLTPPQQDSSSNIFGNGYSSVFSFATAFAFGTAFAIGADLLKNALMKKSYVPTSRASPSTSPMNPTSPKKQDLPTSPTSSGGGRPAAAASGPQEIKTPIAQGSPNLRRRPSPTIPTLPGQEKPPPLPARSVPLPPSPTPGVYYPRTEYPRPDLSSTSS